MSPNYSILKPERPTRTAIAISYDEKQTQCHISEPLGALSFVKTASTIALPSPCLGTFSSPAGRVTRALPEAYRLPYFVPSQWASAGKHVAELELCG